MAIEPGKTHRLAVNTKIKRSYKRPRVFLVEHQDSAFWWRLLGFVAFLGLSWGVWIRLRRGAGALSGSLNAMGQVLWENRSFVFLVLCAVIARLIMAPYHQTGDLFQSAVVYAEDFFHKAGWNYAELSSDYFSAKYDGKSHMHKPPGLYYQFVVLRWLFTFGYIFYIYLTAMPTLIGDLLLAYVLYTACTRYSSKLMAQSVVILFLMCSGIFLASAVIKRVDSVPIALLILAVMNQGKTRFVFFLGLAVASKHLALFAVPWLFFDRRTTKATLMAGVVTLALCLPYLLDDPILFLKRLSVPQITKPANGSTWLVALKHLGVDDVQLVLNGRLDSYPLSC